MKKAHNLQVGDYIKVGSNNERIGLIISISKSIFSVNVETDNGSKDFGYFDEVIIVPPTSR